MQDRKNLVACDLANGFTIIGQRAYDIEMERISGLLTLVNYLMVPTEQIENPFVKIARKMYEEEDCRRDDSLGHRVTLSNVIAVHELPD